MLCKGKSFIHKAFIHETFIQKTFIQKNSAISFITGNFI